jgi:hypothetical protein
MIKDFGRLFLTRSAQASDISTERRFHRNMSRLLFGVTVAWVVVLSYGVAAAVM